MAQTKILITGATGYTALGFPSSDYTELSPIGGHVLTACCPIIFHTEDHKGHEALCPEGLDERSLAIYCLETVRKIVPSR
jgi:hypothetical protein